MDFEPKLYAKKIAIGLVVVAMLLVACQIEDIEIDIINSDGLVLFAVHKKDSQDPVPITTFGVAEAYSGKRWDIATFEESSLYKVHEGKKVLKPLDELPKMDAIEVGSVRFGEVPQGFLLQTSPENRIRELEEGKVYAVHAYRGAHHSPSRMG